MTDFIAVHGGSKDSPAWIRRAGWLYGTRNNYLPYDDVHMLDFDPEQDTEQAWLQCLEDVKVLRPALVLAMDFTHEQQYLKCHQRLDDLTRLGVTPLVAIRCGAAISWTPKTYCGTDVRWAFSVPTSYPPGESDWDKYLPPRSHDRFNYPDVFGVIDVHLLGGHPDQWLWIKRHYGQRINIASVDGNALIREARRGKFWSAKYADYVDLRGQGHSTGAIAVLSMRNAARYYNDPTAVIRHGVRVRRCEIAAGLIPRPQRVVQLPLAI